MDRQIDTYQKKGGIWELVNEYCSIKRQIDGYITTQIDRKIDRQKQNISIQVTFLYYILWIDRYGC